MKGGGPLFDFDKKYRKFCLVGVDEAGRGPWAGPVLACAVVLNPDFFHPQINDSKKIPPALRTKLSETIKNNSRWAVGLAESALIDSINILQATIHAMEKALANLLKTYPELQPDLILIDGNEIPKLLPYDQRSLRQGDCKSASIASASIIAKVERDKIMEDYDLLYPLYGFSNHKGYGTKSHRQNLLKHGPSPIHRKSFMPVKKLSR